jgi:hypothetical protein
MNYAELCAEITSYTENAFATDDLNTFITQTEQRVLNFVQLPASWQITTLTATSGAPIVMLPSDYLAIFSVAIIDGSGNQTQLLNKDYSFLREAFPNPATTGVPVNYALSGDYQITLAPTPNTNYPVSFTYFGYPNSITTAGTSWLGDNFSSVLLYGSLVEATIFMKGEQDLMSYYDGKFKEALDLLKNLVDGKNRQDSYRGGQVRYPVK